MINRKINSILLLLGLSVMVTACDSNRIYEESIAVGGNEWAAGDIKTFQFDIEDTISPLNLFINFRTTTDYPYSNLYVFLHSNYPDGYSSKDTLEFELALPNGEWTGENSGTVVENRFLVAQGVFQAKGTYEFGIEHAMRDNPLPEVIDVGFRVELMDVQ